MEGDNSEKIKNLLSLDGFIVLTIDELLEEKNKIPRFAFEALKENKSRIEWKVDALDIFSAYEILRDDYQYVVLRLYPIDVTDQQEQEKIFKNILQVFPEAVKKEKEVVKNKTLTEVEILRKYLEVLMPLVLESELGNKEILLYDIKRVQMINSISSIEEVIKKTIKTLYNKGDIEAKKRIYKAILPITKKLGMFIFPPWFFTVLLSVQAAFSILKILFWSPEKKTDKKITKKNLFSWFKILQKNNSPEKKMFTNKNVFILLKKKYRSSWLDVFKSEGSYFYFYSLLRQNRLLFWLRKIQEYIGMILLYTGFLFVFGIILVGGIFTVEFLFFNGFILIILGMVFVSLVFFFKEI